MQKFSYLVPVYVILLVVMFVLPFYSADGYAIPLHTTSELGAQATPNAWVMNATFILLGIASILEGIVSLKQFWVQKVLIIIFGLGLIFTAIFQHAPITSGVPYNVIEDNLHSIFATVIGFSFTAFAVSAAFIEESKIRRLLAIFVAFAATGLSILMFNVTEYTGLWQRLLFIIAFGWMIFFFEGWRAR